MTSSLATDSDTPAACPKRNDTVFSGASTTPCTSYKYLCSTTYDDSDFYDTETYYPTPEQCTAQCNAQNFGGDTPCVGIVWNTTSSGANCRTLKSTDMPIADNSSVALLLVSDDSCYSITTSSMTTTPSATFSPPIESRTWGSKSWSRKHSWSGNHTGTWTRPSGTWTHPHTMPAMPTYTTTVLINDTMPSSTSYYTIGTTTGMTTNPVSANGTSMTTSVAYPNTTSSYSYSHSYDSSRSLSYNHTTRSHNYTTSSPYTTSSSVISVMPTSSSNATTSSSSCPAGYTATETKTVYASMNGTTVTEFRNFTQVQTVYTATNTRTREVTRVVSTTTLPASTITMTETATVNATCPIVSPTDRWGRSTWGNWGN